MSKIVGVTVGTPLSLTRIKQEIEPVIEDHEKNKENPHGVTKDQVGLGNVDNTSDLDKPVSTAQAEAISDAKKAGTDAQTAAEERVLKTGDTMTGNLSIPTPTEATHATNKAYVDSLHFVEEVEVPASGWSNSAPYTQTIAAMGILSTDRPHYGVVYSDDTDTALAEKEAFALVDDLDTAGGSVKFTCFEEKPEVDLTIQMEVNR